MKKLSASILFSLFSCIIITGQVVKELPFKMEEITSPQFITAVEKSGGVCIIPLGIIEKHGPHLPLGTDMFEARECAFTAAKKEYAVVFPPYYFGQIFEARHQPGTISYSTELMWKVLEETCGELSRNGLKKIILLNGHGGNNNFLGFFCQAQLASSKDYVVVLFNGGADKELDTQVESLKKAKLDGHAGEEETSMMTVIRPDLVDLPSIKEESGVNQAKLAKMKFGYTGIWWYAQFPNHFASDVADPDKKLGELLIEKEGKQLAELVKYMKGNSTIEKLQEEFSRKAENPLQK